MIKFPKPTVEQFFRTYVITDFTVSVDEKHLLFSSNMDGKMNLWGMDLPNTAPYLFAHHDESVNFIKFDPNNHYVLAGYDKDGDENYQIYALPSEGGLPQPFITGESEEKYYFTHLSEDGERVYYMTSKDNPSFLNARMRNLVDGKDILIHEGEISPTELAAVSEDETAFVYLRMFANTYSIGFVQVGEENYPLTPDPEKVHVTFELHLLTKIPFILSRIMIVNIIILLSLI
ncbi:WD40 repeat protein [Natronobacillus azotifigens]